MKKMKFLVPAVIGFTVLVTGCAQGETKAESKQETKQEAKKREEKTTSTNYEIRAIKCDDIATNVC